MSDEMDQLNDPKFISMEYDKIGESFLIIFKNTIIQGNHYNFKNYKLCVNQPLIMKIVNIILKYKNNDKLFEYLINNNIFLVTLTNIIKGHEYLNQLKNLILKYKNSIDIPYLLNVSAGKGMLPTFIFWKNLLNENIFTDKYNTILSLAIKNSDDRIYKWYLKELKNNNSNVLYFQKSLNIVNILKSILKSQIPIKYILKRIRILSENCNLIPYFDTMIIESLELEVLSELFKYYYYTPISSNNIRSIVNKYIDSFHVNKNNYIQQIFNLLKTDTEKQMLVVLIIVKDENKCCGFLNYNLNIKKEVMYQIKGEIDIHIMGIMDCYEEKKSLCNIFDNENCNCGKKCFPTLLNNLCKMNFFHKLTYIERIYIPSLLQLLTKFYSPIIQNEMCYNFEIKRFIKINKLLSFLRIISKKKAKVKVINFQSNFFPVLQELVHFPPANKMVLKNGSLKWQYNKNKFTNLPPRNLLPYEINIYNNFLLRLKADGILVNNLPINIIPKYEEIVIRQVKAEYIEDLDLYLIFDIDIPNTSIIDRYELLRNNHSATKHTKLVTVNNMNELLNEIKKEQIIFNKFIESNDKIKWYPKVSFLIKDCSPEFKKDLMKDFEFSEKYNCDGFILSPLMNNYNFRDIKIKPKKYMTIDLLFDGTNWLDKEHNKYNNIIIKTSTKYKQNKIYRCYPIDNLYQPREIRFDKKFPNSYDIINSIKTIYNFNEVDIYNDKLYYHLTKPKINSNFINLLQNQTAILEDEIVKLNPENSKTWLDLGCGKGKLINIIKKYNPKKYVGLDNDINILLQNVYKIDENDWVKFNHCDLRKNWFENPKWYNIENMKFDYIILNFSLMHLFDSDIFWSNLKLVCKPNTKILFNIVSENIKDKDFLMNNAYMKYTNDKVKYYFPWSHTKEVEENFISKDSIHKKLSENKFKIESITNHNNNNLSCLYDWFIITCINLLN
jgi:SAM-dependent methyltransferase